MRRRWHKLVGTLVVDRDGRHMGRVRDVLAAPGDDHLEVTALVVGPLARLTRIGQRRWLPDRVEHHEVPWEVVARVDDRIRLSVTAAEARDMVIEGES